MRAPGGRPVRPVSQPSSCQRTRSAMTAAIRARGAAGSRGRREVKAERGNRVGAGGAGRRGDRGVVPQTRERVSPWSVRASMREAAAGQAEMVEAVDQLVGQGLGGEGGHVDPVGRRVEPGGHAEVGRGAAGAPGVLVEAGGQAGPPPGALGPEAGRQVGRGPGRPESPRVRRPRRTSRSARSGRSRVATGNGARKARGRADPHAGLQRPCRPRRTAYPALATWTSRGVYDDLLSGLGDGMAAGLAVGLGEPESDTVFRRSFSVLVLGECVARDNAAGLSSPGRSWSGETGSPRGT